MLRRAVGSGFPATDFGAVPMLLTLLGLILVGGRRILHLRYEQSDPVLARFGGLSRLPAPRTVSAWMQRFRSEDGERLSKLNEELVAAALRRTGPPPAHPRRRRVGGQHRTQGEGRAPGLQRPPAQGPYYPITAYEAQEGQIVRLLNRPGNIHDGKAAVGFLNDLIRQVRTAVGRLRTLEVRMDGAFFRQDVLKVLHTAAVEYAIKVPFYPWLHLKQAAARAYWTSIDERTSYYETRLTVWGRVQRIVLYRRKVAHQTRKNFQLDLFSPEDGHYEYSAITTNKRVQARTLWHFYNGRGSHEKAYAELKGGLPSTACRASRSRPTPPGRCSVCSPSTSRVPFRPATLAPARNTNRKRRTRRRFDSIHTLRFKLLGRAAVVLRHPETQRKDHATSRQLACRRHTLPCHRKRHACMNFPANQG